MGNMTLREARTLVNLTAAELATKAGLDRSTIYDLEANPPRNNRPSWELVYRVTEALREAGLPGVTYEQLFPVSKAA